MATAPARLARYLAKLSAAISVAPVLGVACVSGRRATARRRRVGLSPRLAWGPTPIISIRNWSRGMRALGYETTTLVWDVYPIHERADFDLLRSDHGPKTRLFELWRDYAPFVWVLRNSDVVLTFFDGGFLQNTPYRWLELRILRLAGKAIVVSPYGGDVAVRGHLAGWEMAMPLEYPEVIARSAATRERVDWFSRWADVTVRNVNPGYIPRVDVLWPNQYAVDATEFEPGVKSAADGRNGRVTVLHAPNHRLLKGTPDLLRAVETLRGEGLDVDLVLIEGRPNREVRAALRDADIVAEQFLVGYGLLAVEGMASGAAVLSNVGWLPAEIRSHPAVVESPIVDADPETLTDRLRELVVDPARRAHVGSRGPEYVRRWHSDAAAASNWSAIFEAVWQGRPVPPESRPLVPDSDDA
jgi:glycosyltransferase involved in cell wall biosynthesis